MEYAAYIALLETLKQQATNKLIGVMPNIERLAYEALIDWLAESMTVNDGMLEASDKTVDMLNGFDTLYLETLNNIRQYRGAVTQFVQDVTKLSDAMREFQESANKIDWAAANIAPTQKLVVSEILNAYQATGLNAEFVQPLRDLIYQNVAGGASLKDLREQLKAYVISGKDKSGKLARYVQSTAQQAADSYTGAINKKLMDTFEYPYVVMSGSLIATSSPQCRKAISEHAGVFDKKYFETTLKPIAEKNGLMNGTTFQNLPFNKLHWGCRHEFTPLMVLPEKLKNNELFVKVGQS